MNIKSRRRKITVTILSLSLLTVMAGAAVAPALDVIKNSFPNTSQTLIQMIISIPVSYTHLDVYKRQLFCHPSGPQLLNPGAPRISYRPFPPEQHHPAS